jgi:hypothetical protein
MIVLLFVVGPQYTELRVHKARCLFLVTVVLTCVGSYSVRVCMNAVLTSGGPHSVI